MAITITLPYPDRQLFPNARVHRMVKAQAVRNARGVAKYTVLEAASKLFPHLKGNHFPIEWTFYPPSKRRADLDNVHAACKAYQDGIADALDIDDHCFKPVSLDWGEPVKGGKVVVTIGA